MIYYYYYYRLSGYHPFDTYGDLPEPEVIRNVRAAKYDFNDSIWQTISEERMF